MTHQKIEFYKLDTTKHVLIKVGKICEVFNQKYLRLQL